MTIVPPLFTITCFFHVVRQNISLALVGSIFRSTVPKVLCEIMICVFCVSGIRDCFESGGIVACVGKVGGIINYPVANI